MHELSVTQSLLEIALNRAGQAQARRVTDLHLVVGALSPFVDSSVQFYWDIVSEGTAAQGARLHFERMPLQLICSECQQRFAPDGESFDCPQCGSSAVRVTGGDQFYLHSIEIENGAAP